MALIERDCKDHPVSAFYSIGLLLVAQGPNQFGLDLLQKYDIHIFSGNPVPVHHNILRKKFPTKIWRKCETIHHCLNTVRPCKKISIFFILQIVNGCNLVSLMDFLSPSQIILAPSSSGLTPIAPRLMLGTPNWDIVFQA